jgi:hypothetical protein
MYARSIVRFDAAAGSRRFGIAASTFALDQDEAVALTVEKYEVCSPLAFSAEGGGGKTEK